MGKRERVEKAERYKKWRKKKNFNEITTNANTQTQRKDQSWLNTYSRTVLLQMTQIDLERGGSGGGGISHGQDQTSSSNDENTGVKRRSQPLVADHHRGYDSDGGINDQDRSLLSSSRRSSRRYRGSDGSLARKYPAEWYKTVVMFVYALFCILVMSIVEAIVHDKVPPQNTTDGQPTYLHDIFWNITSSFCPQGCHSFFRATEIIGLVLMGLTLLHIVNHRHTSIVLRRFFFHFGTVYFYRVLTISVTILPVPKLPEHHCMAPTDGTWGAILKRAFGVLAGGGMDMTGKNMCGDYMYSGHTCVLTSAALFILEYSPKRWWLYHYLVTVSAIIGVLSIAISHEHYTIDLIAAYYVCTHHFWSFHTLAANQDLKNASNDKNMFKRVWWWRIFVFMEGNTIPIPRVHTNPITKIRRFVEKISCYPERI